MSVILSPEEITSYRQQFAESPEAITALDVIEHECEGHLEDAFMLLMIQETNQEPDRAFELDELIAKCRPVICANRSKKILAIAGLLTPLLEVTAVGVALALLLYIISEDGLEKFCNTSNSQN